MGTVFVCNIDICFVVILHRLSKVDCIHACSIDPGGSSFYYSDLSGHRFTFFLIKNHNCTGTCGISHLTIFFLFLIDLYQSISNKEKLLSQQTETERLRKY